MRSSTLLLALLGLATFAVVLAALPALTDTPAEQHLRQLRAQRAHQEDGSTAAAKVDRMIRGLEELEDGASRADRHDPFAQALHEMKVPSDREHSEYKPGYRSRELTAALRRAKAPGVPLPWIERGPGNLAGGCRDLLVDPIDPTGNTWFVGSVGGGIWWTDDAGANWTRVTTDPQSFATPTLAQNGNVIYAGTGESFQETNDLNGNGLLKSIDRGLSWTPLASSLDDARFNNITRVVVDPNDANVVLAAANTGVFKYELNATTNIFKSTDGGMTWTTTFKGDTWGWLYNIQDLKANPLSFNTILAGMESGGIYKSMDAGDTWSESNTGITDLTGRFEIAISPVDTNRVFACSEGLGGTGRLWVSYDGGTSWTETIEATGPDPNWLGGSGWINNTVLCHPTDADIVYLGGIQLWKVQMLDTSQRVTTLLDRDGVHEGQSNLVLLPGDGGTPWRLLNSNDGGVAVSSDRDSGWSTPIQGLNTTQFYGVDKKPGSSVYVGGIQDHGTWLSPEDPGASDYWTYQFGADGLECSWHFNDPLKIIASSPYNNLQRSLDGGLTWQDASDGLENSYGVFMTDIAKSNDSPDLLYVVGGYGVLRSTNFGGSWTLSTMNGSEWVYSNKRQDAAISEANPQVVWAGARMDQYSSIHVSTDNGLTFDPVPAYTAADMGEISGLATHPHDDQVAYALFSFADRPKILRTSDQGANWEDISGFAGGAPSTNGFPDVAVYDLLVLPHEPNTLWAGTEIGLFESTDNGASWHLADNGLPNTCIWEMKRVEDEIVIATHGLGVWTVEIPEMTIGETYSPLLYLPYQSPPGGSVFVGTHFRSAYDSTQVMVEAAVFSTIPASASGDKPTIEIPVLSNGVLDIQLKSFKDGIEYPSVLRSVQVLLVTEPQASYSNDFNTTTEDFVGPGFTVRTYGAFDDPALHSQHFYPNDLDASYTLTIPILVADANALMEFDEVVMVEPGVTGSQYGDPSFRDYVIVEGTSSDVIQWVPLLDGYDSSDDPDWLNQWNGTGYGLPSLFKHRVIDLHDTFAPGNTILVRFRLYSDADIRGWGWTIDNLSIQDGNATDTGEELQRRFALNQNYPNPFNPSTVIRYELPRPERVSLRIYDQRGRLVRTLVEGEETAGSKQVIWDGRAQGGAPVASGVYFYQLVAGETVAQRKMALVR